jgi:hypothetical protein
MNERPHNFVVPVTRDELAMIHALAKAGDEPATFMMRRMIKGEYRRRFGDVPPPPIVLKGEKKKSKSKRGGT